MAYSELLADRVRRLLREKHVSHEEKRMMGGLCFMVDGKMCAGVIGEDLMARIGPGPYEAALKKQGCRMMDFTGRPMKGYVFVGPEGMDLDEELEEWVQMCLDFNPQAKSSTKKV